MADKIADLLMKRDFDEPPEVRLIKDFIRKKFDADASVSLQKHNILIEVKGAALAGALRMHVHELTKLCASEKRLVIRIR